MAMKTMQHAHFRAFLEHHGTVVDVSDSII